MENPYEGQKAAAYARFSSHSQTEQSIEGQLRDIREFAKRNGITIVNEYIDRAMTGTKDNRPAFQQMIKDSDKKQFTLVLVWKLDRFARDRYDAATYRNKLKKNGVVIVSVMENISNTPEGIILESVLEGMAEYYSRNLSENIKRGQRESILKGWFPGGNIPFGYRHVDHHLIPDPKEAPIVQEIFERYAHGEKTVDIVNDMNQRGIKFKHGRSFQQSTIPNMINNTVYMGDLCYSGRVIEGCATPIVESGLYTMAVERLNHNRHAPAASRKPGTHYYLLGKLFCGECGDRMAGDGGVSRTGKYHYYYTCHSRKKNSKSCNSNSLRKDDIEYAICRIISDFLMDKNRPVLEIMADCIEAEYNTGFEMQEIRDLEARLRGIELDLDKLVDSIIDMPPSARPRISRRMEDLEKQKTDVEITLARKRLECVDVFTKDDFLKFLRLMMTDLDNEQNRIFIIQKFLEKAYIYNDGRIVIYINWFNGHPHAYDPDDPPPDPDGYHEGKKIFDGKIPEGLASLPDFRRGSTLITYAPPNADKLEPRLPHFFFLKGKLGIVAWMKDLRK